MEIGEHQESLETDEVPLDAKDMIHKLINDDSHSGGVAPRIYNIPTKVTYQDESKFIRQCVVGLGPKESVNPNAETKVILTVGATGAGKTTLVDGMINYALGVKFEDPFRFRIMTDTDERGRAQNQALSQTNWVTAYTLYPGRGNKINYTLTIIDTPGFGDTGGLKKDEELLEKLRSLFSAKECGIDSLHGICFVAQSSLARLTPSQKYVFDGVLSIFGNNVAKNIFLLLTFADSEEPPVVAAVEEAEVPYKKYFKFNNSALFAKRKTRKKEGDDEEEKEKQEDDEDIGMDFNKMFWNLGFTSFKKFFVDLCSITPVSLMLTKDVLDKRARLQTYICGLQENIQKGINALSTIEQEKKVAKDLEADIGRNKNFKYTVEEHHTVKVNKAPGQHVTNCQSCNRTCHETCAFANDEEKRHCAAMDGDGYCKVCTPANGKCIWSIHYNMKYYFRFEVRQVEKTVEEMLQKYKLAEGEKRNKDELIMKINQTFCDIQNEVLAQTNEVRQCLATLSEIALKPNPLTTVDYIDQLISAEKTAAKPGFKERILQLEQAKKRAQYLQQFADEGFDPFEEAKKKIDSAESGSYWKKMGKALGGILQIRNAGAQK